MLNKLKAVSNKLYTGLLLSVISVQIFAKDKSGVAGVDEHLTMGQKVTVAIGVLVGFIAIIGGAYKFITEKKDGKSLGVMLGVVGIVILGITAYWTEKTQGFMF